MAEWKIATSSEGDWVALIKGDEVVEQHHDIAMWRIFELLGIDLEDLGEYDMEDYGWFPDRLQDWPGRVKKVS